MEKKTTKKAVKTTIKDTKKKVVKKKKTELPILAPETTPSPLLQNIITTEPKLSFLDKVKKFLGF